MVIELGNYQHASTAHLMGSDSELLAFIDWAEDTNLEIWEPRRSDEGERVEIDFEKRRRHVTYQLDEGIRTPTLWFVMSDHAAVAIKLRWTENLRNNGCNS